jgi:hypothetical protein
VCTYRRRDSRQGPDRSCFSSWPVGEEVTEHHLAFMEELWPFTPRIPDVLVDVYGHKILYSLKTRKVFYVLEMSRILGPASIQ